MSLDLNAARNAARLSPENREKPIADFEAHQALLENLGSRLCVDLEAIGGLIEGTSLVQDQGSPLDRRQRDRALVRLVDRAREDAERLDALLTDRLRTGHPYAVLLDCGLVGGASEEPARRPAGAGIGGQRRGARRPADGKRGKRPR